MTHISRVKILLWQKWWFQNKMLNLNSIQLANSGEKRKSTNVNLLIHDKEQILHKAKPHLK